MPRLSSRLRRKLVAKSLSVTRPVENRYVNGLRAVMAEIVKHYLPFAESPPSGVNEVHLLAAKIQTQVPHLVRPLFETMAVSVMNSNAKALAAMGIKGNVAKPIHNDDRFSEAVARGHGDVGLAPAIAAARDKNVNLISKAGRAYAQDVEDIFSDPDTAGLRVEEITKLLVDRGNVAASRAELIARDQVTKLSGDITQLRQQNAGVTSYTWSTSGDERVREEHAARDGQQFDWNSPPDGGHPGEDIQCRCVAIPVVDEFEGI